MSTATITAQFSFLTAGPKFRMYLPGDVYAIPELSTPLTAGHGGRSFDFLPPFRNNGVTDNALIGTLPDRDGRIVELFKWPFDPPQWYLRWPLTAGALYTHLRDEDGEEMAEVTVQSLAIVEDGDTRLPFLLPEPPLRPAVLARPGYQELATFVSWEEPGWGVILQRPGYLSLGQTVVQPQGADDPVVVRAGAPYGMEVQVVTSDLPAAKAAVDTVLGSLEEG